MSTAFKPLEIPPGVVAKATKKMQSSNWSEVNCVRWREGQLMPIGGQTAYTYSFASRCKAIHGWYGLDGLYRIAYLCEANLYVDVGGTLYDISPVPPISPPTSALQGGYGDLAYNTGPPDTYSTPRDEGTIFGLDRVPDAYSLDNFGAVLYAMTSADGRLLRWDSSVGVPGVVGSAVALGSFGTSSPTIRLNTHLPALVVSGMNVYDVQLAQNIGVVLSYAPATSTVAATAPWLANAIGILTAAGVVGVGPGLLVHDNTSGHDVGNVASYGPVSASLNATAAFDAIHYGVYMPPNPGNIVQGMTVTDVTTSQSLGVVAAYGPFTFTGNATASWFAGDIVLPFPGVPSNGLLPGMTVHDNTQGMDLGTIGSVAGNKVTMAAPLPVGSTSSSSSITFSSGTSSVLQFAAAVGHASAGGIDVLQISSGANAVLVLAAPTFFASSGSTDSLLISGGDLLTLTANPSHASFGASDTLEFSGNRSTVQPADSGRGPVPNGRFFVVTPERFLIIYGSYNDGTGAPSTFHSRRFAWCDQENPGAWDYTNVVSMAGFLDVEPAAPIQCGISTRTGVLFFTGKKAYRSRFLGMPYIYNYEELADNCTPWSPQSMATTSSMVLWMSEQGMYSFDGTSILPVGCLVRPWIDDDIDILNVRTEACAVHLSTHNEWWWFYPQKGQPYNTRAMVYGYKEGWFGQARMSRSAGVTASYNSHSIMADGLIAMQHETYDSYVHADPPFAETFDLNVAAGARLVTVKQLLPDIEMVDMPDPADVARAIAQLRYSLFYRNSRSLGDAEQQTDFKFVRPNGYVDFRTTGRDIRLRIDLPTASVVPFTIGQHMIDVSIRGDR